MTPSREAASRRIQLAQSLILDQVKMGKAQTDGSKTAALAELSKLLDKLTVDELKLLTEGIRKAVDSYKTGAKKAHMLSVAFGYVIRKNMF